MGSKEKKGGTMFKKHQYVNSSYSSIDCRRTVDKRLNREDNYMLDHYALFFSEYLLFITVDMTKLHVPLQVICSFFPLRGKLFTVPTPFKGHKNRIIGLSEITVWYRNS